MQKIIIAIDKHFNECQFSEAAWGQVKNKNDYIVFKSNQELEKYWRTKHPGRHGNRGEKVPVKQGENNERINERD
jgi:hypothetical protein